MKSHAIIIIIIMIIIIIATTTHIQYVQAGYSMGGTSC